MATYTPEEWVKQHNAKMNDLLKSAFDAISSVHALQVARIFDESGIPGAKYNSTTPLYVSPKSAPPKAVDLKGKNGNTNFKNGKPHKTGFYKSYAAFRRAMGRGTSFVNLNLTGVLESDYANSLTQQGNTFVTGTKNKANSEKLNHIFKRYGTGFIKLTPMEHKTLIKIAVASRLKLGL